MVARRQPTWQSRMGAAALTALALLAGAPSARAEMVTDLGSIPDALRTPEGREVFAEQMGGVPPPDDLGSALPPGLSAASVAALLVPPGDHARLGTIGAKPWSAWPGHFIALACTGGDGAGKKGVDGCTSSGGPSPLHAYLGVIELAAGGMPKLAARPLLVDPTMDWRGSLLPNGPEAVDHPIPGDAAPPPSSYDRLDLAPYRIAPDKPAFGLRASWSDGFMGGFGWHSGMFLFAVVDGALRPVLAVPVLAMTDFAGDRHEDGSRAHEIHEGANVIVVSNHLSEGHFDLVVRSRLKRGERLFRWQPAAGAYHAVPR